MPSLVPNSPLGCDAEGVAGDKVLVTDLDNVMWRRGNPDVQQYIFAKAAKPAATRTEHDLLGDKAVPDPNIGLDVDGMVVFD